VVAQEIQNEGGESPEGAPALDLLPDLHMTLPQEPPDKAAHPPSLPVLEHLEWVPSLALSCNQSMTVPHPLLSALGNAEYLAPPPKLDFQNWTRVRRARTQYISSNKKADDPHTQSWTPASTSIVPFH
jgi:hypothetical protein